MQEGQPALPGELVDRENEVESIISSMKSKVGQNIAVIGYRRIGKTSILVKVKDELSKEKNIVVVYFDVKKNMAEPKIFLTRLEKAIFSAYLEKISTVQKLKTKASKAKSIPPKLIEAITSKKIKGFGIQISPEGTITPKIELDDKKINYSDLFFSVLETPKVLGEKNNFKFVVILDEFQDLIELSRHKGFEDIFGLFRSMVQERGKKVSYIISGSRVHMLRSILEKGESSLFLHFKEQVITEMSEVDAKKLFNKYVKDKGLTPKNAAASQAYSIVGGHPFYLMTLADEWKPNEEVSVTFNRSLNSEIGRLKLYVDYVLSEDVGLAQGGPILRTILRALSDSDEGYRNSELAKKIGIEQFNLPVYLKGLVKADLVSKGQKNYIIRDKVVREYLKQEAAELE